MLRKLSKYASKRLRECIFGEFLQFTTLGTLKNNMSVNCMIEKLYQGYRTDVALLQSHSPVCILINGNHEYHTLMFIRPTKIMEGKLNTKMLIFFDSLNNIFYYSPFFISILLDHS